MRRFPAAMAALTACLAPQGIAFLLPIGAWAKLAALVTFTCGTMIACCFTNLIAIPAIQMSTPEAMTGKVMAMTSAIAMCAQPLGQMIYGWAYDRFSVAAVLLATAAAAALLTAAMAPLSKRFGC